jgi:hypothetical protein
MYKKTHKTLQGRADGTRTLALNGGDESLTAEERHAILNGKAQEIQLRLLKVPTGPPERRTLGASLARINFELSQLKIQLQARARTGIHLIFYEVAQRVLTKEQFDAVLAEAQHVYDLRNAPIQKKSAAKYAEELGRALNNIRTEQ